VQNAIEPRLAAERRPASFVPVLTFPIGSNDVVAPGDNAGAAEHGDVGHHPGAARARDAATLGDFNRRRGLDLARRFAVGACRLAQYPRKVAARRATRRQAAIATIQLQPEARPASDRGNGARERLLSFGRNDHVGPKAAGPAVVLRGHPGQGELRQGLRLLGASPQKMKSPARDRGEGLFAAPNFPEIPPPVRCKHHTGDSARLHLRRRTRPNGRVRRRRFRPRRLTLRITIAAAGCRCAEPRNGSRASAFARFGW
jgi:hypothetical protein